MGISRSLALSSDPRIMSLRLGYNTNGFAHHKLEDALFILADLGYRSVALTLDHHALDPFAPDLPLQRDRIAALLERLQLRCVIETGARFLLDPRHKHQPTLLSTRLDDRERRLEFLRRSIDLAADLHADAVSFWSGTPDTAVSTEILWDRLSAHCQELADHADARGVVLGFEPEPGMFVDTMGGFAELVRRVRHPAFRLTLDVGHLHCQGETPIASHISTWAALLVNVHIEDMRKGIHDHLMFGEGEMDFPEIMAALQRVGYTGGVYVELSRHSHNAVETARRALAFLGPLAD